VVSLPDLLLSQEQLILFAQCSPRLFILASSTNLCYLLMRFTNDMLQRPERHCLATFELMLVFLEPPTTISRNVTW